MPAREGAYDSAELTEQFPEDLLVLWRESIDSAGPRPPTPYWSTVVNAVLSGWHPANSVDPESTPASSSAFVAEVLSGDALS
jgi:multiple sugar transport system substrate-binding protein